jgi:hypothetical protein
MDSIIFPKVVFIKTLALAFSLGGHPSTLNLDNSSDSDGISTASSIAFKPSYSDSDGISSDSVGIYLYLGILYSDDVFTSNQNHSCVGYHHYVE